MPSRLCGLGGGVLLGNLIVCFCLFLFDEFFC